MPPRRVKERKAVHGNSQYDAKYCETIIALGREGKSLAQMASIMGFNRQTMVNWCQQYPEFNVAYDMAVTHAQAWWEDKAAEVQLGGLHPVAWKKSVESRFSHEYTEKKEVHSTGTLNHKHSLQDMSDDELVAIIAGVKND